MSMMHDENTNKQLQGWDLYSSFMHVVQVVHYTLGRLLFTSDVCLMSLVRGLQCPVSF